MREKTMWIVGVIVLGCLWFGIIYIALRPQFELEDYKQKLISENQQAVLF